jgi:hypothetical protein
MSSSRPTLEMIAAGRRRFIQMAGTLVSLSAFDLVGCGGGNNTDGGKTTAKVLGANTTVAVGTIEFPTGFSNKLGKLMVVNAYSQATAGTDLTFSQAIIASSPSLVSVVNAGGNVIFLGYLDPTLATNVIDALSTAVALLYFAFDFQAFPEANRQQLLGLLKENAATVTLGNMIAQRMLANPLALSQKDTQITQTLISAYDSIYAMGTPPATATAPRLAASIHDTATVNPQLLIQPTGEQSGFSIEQLSTDVGFTGTNYYRREVVLYVYKTASGTPDPVTGITPPLDEPLQIGSPVTVLPTQKISVINALTDVIYGTAPYLPIDTNAITLTLDPGAQRTIYSIVVLGGGAQNNLSVVPAADPAFFSEEIFSKEVAEWKVTAKALFLKTWLIDVFLGSVLELIGAPTVLAVNLDGAAEALLEINNAAWQAAIDEFLEGNIPGAMLGLYNALTASSELMEEVFTIIVSVVNGAAGAAIFGIAGVTEVAAETEEEAAKYLLNEVGEIVLGVLHLTNLLFVVGDIRAVRNDLAAADIGALWTATLTASTISLNPAKASITAGQSVVFTVKLPTGLVPPAGSTTVYDWTQNGALSALTDGGANTGTASIETPLTVVTLTTTPSEQAATITVGVTAYFVDAGGTKTSPGPAVLAYVTLGAQTGLVLKLATCTQSIDMPASANGLIPAETVYYIWVIPYYTFEVQTGAAYYNVSSPPNPKTNLLYNDRFYPTSNPGVAGVDNYDISALPMLADVLGFPISPLQPSSPTSTVGSYQPDLVAGFTGPAVNFGGGVIGIVSQAALVSPVTGSGQFGGSNYVMMTIDPFADGLAGGSSAEPTTAQLNAAVASLQASVLQQIAQVPASDVPTLTVVNGT